MSVRILVVSRRESGRTVAELLRQRLRLSWSQARRLIHERRVALAGDPCLDPARRVKTGQRLEVKPAAAASSHRSWPTPPVRLPEGISLPVIRHADAAVIVVDKPAGLTTMRHADETAEFGARARRFLPPTLADLLPGLLARRFAGKPYTPIIPVHRLDKETSGLVVFARTPTAARHLGKQFRAHTIDRCYLALVRGPAHSLRIESNLVADRGDGRRGSSSAPGAGKPAVTHVKVLENLVDYTLVECRLETGRTHQVRIHLGEQGTPLCGDHLYDRPLHGSPLPDASAACRPMLHAARLGFDHPTTGKRMAWDAPMPKDMTRLLRKLRRR
jgi:23S rRNA pseudouridine1911/1915/1917 synthase